MKSAPIFFGKKQGPALSDAALAVLGKAVVSDGWVTLSAEALPRNVYQEVANSLAAVGGKWKSEGKHPNGSPKGRFVFDRFKPAPVLKLILETGHMPAANPTDFYPTPPVIVKDIIEIMELQQRSIWSVSEENLKILEPSAGIGGIAGAVREAFPEARLDVVEYLDVNADILRSKGFGVVHEGDFLEWEAPVEYDFVVMNPPFEKGTWVDHVKHAEAMLASDGILLAVIPRSYTVTAGKVGNFWNEFGPAHGVSIEAEYTHQEFKETGTNIDTMLITLNNIRAVEQSDLARHLTLLLDNNLGDVRLLGNAPRDMGFSQAQTTLYNRYADDVVIRRDASGLRAALTDLVQAGRDHLRVQQRIFSGGTPEIIAAVVNEYLKRFDDFYFYETFWKSGQKIPAAYQEYSPIALALNPALPDFKDPDSDEDEEDGTAPVAATPDSSLLESPSIRAEAHSGLFTPDSPLQTPDSSPAPPAAHLQAQLRLTGTALKYESDPAKVAALQAQERLLKTAIKFS